MRILVVTPHFSPENFKCNDMAFELAARGHDVDVMTAIPDYPKGRFYDGYGLFKRRSETVNGVRVFRSPIIPRGDGSAVRMALNYISYTFFAVCHALRIGLTRKYDAVIVFQISPVMVGIPAVIIRKMRKTPVYFWVLDLWPESLAAAGGIRRRYILGAFGRLTEWLYRNSDKILISSKGFRKSICEKGDFDSRILHFPNWVDSAMERRGGTDYSVPAIPEGFVVMFAGNMGDAQDLPSVMKAAERLKPHGDIHFVFLGDGRMKAWVEEYVREYGLEHTVHCLGRHPLESMPEFFSRADVLFLSLKDTEIFALTVPARLQSYMAAGKQVVAMLNGEGADIIEESQCGYSVPAGDSEALARLLLELSREDKGILRRKGENGLSYSRRHYDFKSSIDTLERLISTSGQ